MRLNAKIIAFKRNDYCVKTQEDIIAFNRKLLRLIPIIIALKRNLLRLNAKIIAFQRNLLSVMRMRSRFERLLKEVWVFETQTRRVSRIHGDAHY